MRSCARVDSRYLFTACWLTACPAHTHTHRHTTSLSPSLPPPSRSPAAFHALSHLQCCSSCACQCHILPGRNNDAMQILGLPVQQTRANGPRLHPRHLRHTMRATIMVHPFLRIHGMRLAPWFRTSAFVERQTAVGRKNTRLEGNGTTTPLSEVLCSPFLCLAASLPPAAPLRPCPSCESGVVT